MAPKTKKEVIAITKKLLMISEVKEESFKSLATIQNDNSEENKNDSGEILPQKKSIFKMKDNEQRPRSSTNYKPKSKFFSQVKSK